MYTLGEIRVSIHRNIQVNKTNSVYEFRFVDFLY